MKVIESYVKLYTRSQSKNCRSKQCDQALCYNRIQLLCLKLHPNTSMGGSLADSSLTYSKLCLVYMTHTLYLDSSSSRQSSSQDFWGSQVAGLGWGLSKPMPPVNRNLHSSSATCFSCLSRFTQSTKENRSCMCVCDVGCIKYIRTKWMKMITDNLPKCVITVTIPCPSQRVIGTHCNTESMWSVWWGCPVECPAHQTAQHCQ